jgi:hypothetical protein
MQNGSLLNIVHASAVALHPTNLNVVDIQYYLCRGSGAGYLMISFHFSSFVSFREVLTIVSRERETDDVVIGFNVARLLTSI